MGTFLKNVLISFCSKVPKCVFKVHNRATISVNGIKVVKEISVIGNTEWITLF